ncbi:nuclear transport factor 2 family protein [Streptomyces sp. NPDC002896]|uniref:nuclear transport factor 2 family protein n=1 Tax=Streptomyces sp. NPDC002896 TaxID=3154438 RepID=UPI00331B169C
MPRPDDGRLDDLVALFTADGVSALPGMEPVQGHDALRQLYRGLIPQAPQRHLVVNTVVTEQDGDRATALSDLEGVWRV